MFSRPCPVCDSEIKYKRKAAMVKAEKLGRVCPACRTYHKHTEETKKKISESLKGRTVSSETRQKIGMAHKGNQWAKGYKQTAEHRRMKSIARGGDGLSFLEGNGPTKSQLQYWSRKVRMRDEHICQHCNYEGPDHLEAHHIVPKAMFPQYALDVDNGITLCWNCHDVEHGNTPRTFNRI